MTFSKIHTELGREYIFQDICPRSIFQTRPTALLKIEKTLRLENLFTLTSFNMMYCNDVCMVYVCMM